MPYGIEAHVNSEERRAARRARREAARAAKKSERDEALGFDSICDMNSLYKAQRQASRGVSWKSSTQRYCADWLLNTFRARRDLLDGNDVRRGFYEFDTCERGKIRHISSVHFSERVVHKSLSQNVLVPSYVPSLIAANTANVKGRGLSLALRILKRDLARHYAKYGSEGYILLMDYLSYFASIEHDQVKRMLREMVADPRTVCLADSFVDAQPGNVGLGLGSEPNQIWAISLPNRVDHYVSEMCMVESYGRYMDDSYAISVDKDDLRRTLSDVSDLCSSIGIELHPTKTKIVKLSKGFTFLKKRIFYGDSGKVVMTQCRDSVTRERRRLKKQAALVMSGQMSMEDMERSFVSWRGSLKGLDTHGTLLSMDALYRSLAESCRAGKAASVA